MASNITRLGFSIFSRYDGNGVRRANRDINQLERNINRSTSGLNNFTGRMGAVVTAAAALGPALLPVGVVLTGITAGTASLAITGGAALGVYGAALQGSAKRTLELEKAGKKLNPVQAQFARSTRVVSREWNHFLDVTSSKTLDVANDGLVAMNNSIKRMPGIVSALHPVMKRISTDIKEWTTNGGLDRFVDIIKKHGVPAFDALRRAGVNVLAALGIGFRTMLPLIKPITNAIERGAKSFRTWAEKGGFSRFLASVQKNGPGVGEFFRQLARATGNLTKAMGNLGPLSLLTATGLLRIAGSIPTSWLTAIVAGFVAWRAVLWGTKAAVWAVRAAILAWTAAQWLLNAAMWSNPITIVIGLVLALVAAIVIIAVKTKWFQTAWKFTWNAVKVTAVTVWRWLKTAWRDTVGALQAAWRAVGGGLRNAWRAVWGAIRSTGLAVWNALKRAWRAVTGGLRSAWNAVGGALRNSWRAVWGGIRNTGVAIWRFMSRTGSSIWNGMRRSFTNVFNGVRRVASNIWNGISRSFKSVWNGLSRWAGGLWRGMSRTVGSIFRGVGRTLGRIWDGIVRGAKKAWNKIKDAVKAPVKWVVNNVISKLAGVFNAVAKAVHISARIHVKKMASGGHVKGPGTGRSDNVPAMLSNGEYVIPANVVKKHGVGFFDRLRGGASPMGVESQGFNGGGNGRGSGPSHGGILGAALGGWIPDPIKNIAKGALNLLVPGASSLMDTFGSWTKKFIRGTLLKVVNAAFNVIPGGGIARDIAKGGARKLIEGAVNFLFKENEEGGGGPIGGKIPKGARLALLRKALSLTHTPPPGTLAAWLKGLNTLITRESNWNAGATNNWDSNAKAGNASVGLMQTIPTTFNAYKMIGHGNIRNGLDNVIAGIRYIKTRYGNITKVQQANANLPPKGYRHGGMVMPVNSFDRGGYLPKGYSIAFNGTGRPEPVGHGGGGVSVNFTNCKFDGGMSKREVENAVVLGLTEAERKGRIRRVKR